MIHGGGFNGGMVSHRVTPKFIIILQYHGLSISYVHHGVTGYHSDIIDIIISLRVGSNTDFERFLLSLVHVLHRHLCSCDVSCVSCNELRLAACHLRCTRDVGGRT